MSMLFSGSRDFAFEIDGVSYYCDGDGYGCDDDFSYDGISEEEFNRAKQKYDASQRALDYLR